MAIRSDCQRHGYCSKSSERRAVGCEAVNGRKSGKAKADDAADFVNKRNIGRVHETYGKGFRVGKVWTRKYQPKACWGMVKFPKARVSSATKPDAARKKLGR